MLYASYGYGAFFVYIGEDKSIFRMKRNSTDPPELVLYKRLIIRKNLHPVPTYAMVICLE